MFKSFQFIDKMNQMLLEAEAMPNEEEDMGGEEMPMEDGEMGGEEMPMEDGGSDAASDPSQIAAPEQGQFVSNLGDAEYASIMIRALASNPAFKDKIPQEFLNAQTTENAQQIIQFVKNMVGLQNSGGETGFNNMSDEQVMNMPA